MKQAKEKTHVDFCTDIFSGKYLDIKGNGKVTIKIDYPKDDSEHRILIEMEREGNTSSWTLYPGDTYILDHCVDITATKDITKKHVFPIIFKMDGQEYKLNRTKQNKLILTK